MTESAAQSTDPMHAPATAARTTVLRGAIVIAVVTVLARIAGFVRYLVFGASVGAGEVGTAYASANLLPNVLFEIAAGGALATLVVPLVAGLLPNEHSYPNTGSSAATDDLAQADDQLAGSSDPRARTGGSSAITGAVNPSASQIISTVLTWTLVITIALAVMVALGAEPIARILLGSTAAELPVATLLLRIFAVQLPLYGIAVVLGAYLQSQKRFLWPAMMPLVSSIVVMIAYRVYASLVAQGATSAAVSQAALQWLGWGTTAGVAAMALPVMIAAAHSGLRVRPSFRMPAGWGGRARSLAIAGLGAVAAQQLVMGLILLLSMRTGGTGTLPVFQYAQALYLLPYAVLVVPVMTSMFPHLSEQRLVGDREAFTKLTAAGLRTVIIVAVAGSAALMAAAPSLEQFFRLIDRAAISGVGPATAAHAIGLAGFAVTMQCTRVLSAAMRARDALLVGSAGWMVAGVLIVAVAVVADNLAAGLAATAFGLAISAGMTVGAITGLSRVHALITDDANWRPLARTAGASPVAIVVGAVIGLLLTHSMVSPRSSEVTAVLAGATGGIVAGVISMGVMAIADFAHMRRILESLRARISTRRRPSVLAAAAPPASAPAAAEPESHAPAEETAVQ